MQSQEFASASSSVVHAADEAMAPTPKIVVSIRIGVEQHAAWTRAAAAGYLSLARWVQLNCDRAASFDPATATQTAPPRKPRAKRKGR